MHHVQLRSQAIILYFMYIIKVFVLRVVYTWHYKYLVTRLRSQTWLLIGEVKFVAYFNIITQNLTMVY